jgi:hypothetical protein
MGFSCGSSETVYHCVFRTSVICVQITSLVLFNIASHLQGPHNRFRRCIEEQGHGRLPVHGALHFGAGSDEEIPLHILVVAETEADLMKAQPLCEDRVSNAKDQKPQDNTCLTRSIDCGDDWLLSWRFGESPPRGSAEDVKVLLIVNTTTAE